MTAPVIPAAAASIVAQAFRFMELAPPSSFADDTPQAQDAREQYPLALQASLEANDWSFASVMVFLPEATEPEALEFDPDLPHLFKLPGDALVVREVGDRHTTWRRDRGGLRADEPGPLRLRYTGRITNEAALPAAFQHAIAFRLAVLLAPRWLGTSGKIEALEDRAARALRMAARQDSGSASPASWSGEPLTGDWVTEARW